MKVPIKFRGKCLNAEKTIVYGDLIQAPYDLPVIRVFNDKECKKGICTYEDYEVYPESVAQLVGYDANGDEIYKDDTLFNQFGDEYKVDLTAIGIGVVFRDKSNLRDLTLRKEINND